MKLLSIFKRRNQKTSLTEILRKDEVNRFISEFIQEYDEGKIKNTDGIMLIWIKDGELFFDSAGIETEAEALGILSYVDYLIKKEGLIYK